MLRYAYMHIYALCVNEWIFYFDDKRLKEFYI